MAIQEQRLYIPINVTVTLTNEPTDHHLVVGLINL